MMAATHAAFGIGTAFIVGLLLVAVALYLWARPRR